MQTWPIRFIKLFELVPREIKLKIAATGKLKYYKLFLIGDGEFLTVKLLQVII